MLGELADQPLALVIDGLGQYDLENDVEIAIGLITAAGNPWPRNRSFIPLELPGGIVNDFKPLSVGTSFSRRGRLQRA